MGKSRTSTPRNPTPRLPHEDTVDAWLERLRTADVLTLIHIERTGFKAALIRSLADRLGLSMQRVYCVVGLPGAGNRRSVSGSSALATIGLLRLIQQVENLVAESCTDKEGFDAARWLGAWIESPVGALGHRCPADFLDTPTGNQLVAGVIGAMQSGAYL